jgi:glutathione S-transferase
VTDVPRLITFAPMIDSETWRLLLRHYRVAYQEEPHAFIWGSVLSLIRAGSPQVPALCGAGLRMVGPDAAIDRWDAGQPLGHALVPPDPAMSAVARRDWDLFHGTLATHTARLAYYHLLPHRDVLIEPFTRGIPSREASVTRLIYPVQRAVLSLLLQLSAKTAADSLQQIHTVFDATDARVADGRRFLQGDRITLGDVALAAAAAPVTLPDGNQSPIPPLAEMPPAYAAIVEEMRARPTAAFVQRLYRTLTWESV